MKYNCLEILLMYLGPIKAGTHSKALSTFQPLLPVIVVLVLHTYTNVGTCLYNQTSKSILLQALHLQ